MDYVTIKVHEETRQHLRLIAALTGEHMAEVLARLCKAELERVMPIVPKGGAIVLVHHTSKAEGDDEDAERTVIIDELGKTPEEDRSDHH